MSSYGHFCTVLDRRVSHNMLQKDEDQDEKTRRLNT